MQGDSEMLTVSKEEGDGFLKGPTKHGVRQRAAAVVNCAMLLLPPLVPPGFRNPMTPALVGRAKKKKRGLSKPPVSVEELALLVAVLDVYALGLLAPLLLFAPRPSELGRILLCDYNPADSTLTVPCRESIGYWTKGDVDKLWPVNAALAACIRAFVDRAVEGPLFVKRAIFEGRARALLADTSETAMAREYDRGRTRLAMELKRPPNKQELQRLSERVWRAAGAVDDKVVRRELRRAAEAAGLPKAPTPNAIRHLFESLTEAAKLAPGVVRFLMGHGIQRGDALHSYSHTWLDVLRQQVAELDALRQPLVGAMVRRARELRDGA